MSRADKSARTSPYRSQRYSSCSGRLSSSLTGNVPPAFADRSEIVPRHLTGTVGRPGDSMPLGYTRISVDA